MPVRHAVVSAALVAFVVLATATISGAATAPGAEPRPFLNDLEFPTNLAFTPDGRLFFTEKETGSVRVVTSDGRLLPEPFVTLPVDGDAERGLLGIAIDPAFPRRPWVYLYLSDATDGRNRLVRVRANGDVAEGAPQVLLDGLPSAAGYHNGGDLVFGTDGLLYASLGEAHEPDRAQDPNDLGGKIVRLEPDGTAPPDQPFGAGNPVWSIGHRNSFGLCVDRATGTLYETENGPDVDDEVNVIRPGANYGWPRVTGSSDERDLTDPILTFPDTIALTGCVVIDGTLLIGSYGQSAVRVVTGGRSEVVASVPGGITDLAAGPDGDLFVATTDAIWRIPRDELALRDTAVQHAVGTPSPAVLAPVSGRSSAVDEPPATRSALRDWFVVAAGGLLVLGLAMRVVGGRSLRHAAGDVDPDDDVGGER